MKLSRILLLHNEREHHKIKYPDDLGSVVRRGYDEDMQSREGWLEQNADGLKLAMQVFENKTFPWEGASNVKYPLITNACTQFNARAYPALVPSGKVAGFRKKPDMEVQPPAPPPMQMPQGPEQGGMPPMGGGEPPMPGMGGEMPTEKGSDLPIPGGEPPMPGGGQPMPQGQGGEIIPENGGDISPEGVGQMAPMQQDSTMPPVQVFEDDLNYQLTVESTEWEEEQDRNLMVLPLVGCTVKKTFIEPITLRVRSILCRPQNVVFNYWAKSIQQAKRVTHVQHYSENEFEGLVRAGYFQEIDATNKSPYQADTSFGEQGDEAHGFQQPSEGEIMVLEQHTWVDLDGDGYAEPYIVWVHEEQVLRIEPRMKRFYSVVEGVIVESDTVYERDKIVRIDPINHFTLYCFMPSPDGSIMGLGLGKLLGPHNNAVNTILNQLVDAGTLSNVQGGLLSRNVRTRSGVIELVPGVFHKTEANSADLKNGVMPWPVKEPSHVLFQLLGLLIDAGEKISSVSKQMQGQNPGQNQPASTTMSVLEQGLQVFSAVFKRCYRSMANELEKIVDLNRLVRPNWDKAPYGIMPAADPNIVSRQQAVAKAELLVQRSQMMPHFYGMQGQVEAERMYLEALQIDGDVINRMLSQPQQPPPPPEAGQAEFDQKMRMAEFELEKADKMSRMQGNRVTEQTKMVNADQKQQSIDLQKAQQRIDAFQGAAELMLREKEIGTKPSRSGSDR